MNAVKYFKRKLDSIKHRCCFFMCRKHLGWSLTYLQVVDNMERALSVENTSAAPTAGDSPVHWRRCSSSDPLSPTYLSSIKETIKSFAEGLKMTHTGTFTFSFVCVCWSLFSRVTKGMLRRLKEHAIVKVILRRLIWPAIWTTSVYTDTYVIFYGIMNHSFFSFPFGW